MRNEERQGGLNRLFSEHVDQRPCYDHLYASSGTGPMPAGMSTELLVYYAFYRSFHSLRPEFRKNAKKYFRHLSQASDP